MIDFGLRDFYGLMKEAVMYSKPQGEDMCKTLQSWAVLGERSDIEEKMFGLMLRDLEKGYMYFSRGAGEQFPALIASVRDGQRLRLSTSSGGQDMTEFEIELGVVDRYRENCEGCTYCGKRSIEEIYMDTEELLLSAVNYLRGVNRYRVSRDGEPLSEEWQNEKIVTELLAAGEITGAEKIVRDSVVFQRMVKRNNDNADQFRFRWLDSSIYGSYIIMRVVIDRCADLDYDPDYQEWNEELKVAK